MSMWGANQVCPNKGLVFFCSFKKQNDCSNDEPVHIHVLSLTCAYCLCNVLSQPMTKIYFIGPVNTYVQICINQRPSPPNIFKVTILMLLKGITVYVRLIDYLGTLPYMQCVDMEG